VTLAVNLFGGPGCGKSTMAADIFQRLKRAGVTVELVNEFAKDLTWEGAHGALQCQPYVTGQQIWRMQRLIAAKVPVIVTDSPVLLGGIYTDDVHLHGLQMEWHDRIPSLNYMVQRTKKYDPAGRNQTEDEAKVLDRKIERFLHSRGVGFRCLDYEVGAEAVAARVKMLLKSQS